MSREIKFRGMRSDGKGWVLGYYSPVNVPILGTLGHCINEGGYRAIDIEYSSLGQFTGLKDKNGVDIYEGDVISSDTVGTVKHPVETYIHLVEWKGLGFHFKSLDKGLKGVLSNTMLHSPEQVTVIGNIHQHPELLKGDQQNG